ncbi:hypothetical protein PAL_GLEAN10009276 [Pteropus alecto]|uniref:Uncharacterized protein n=1 Tax=Pteropus alecto TaxID=9402 RepID=L5KWI5_PTEAL|nr:hypothetical protein PAL_GLEAN10009276 [Pteropus alecto]
MKDGTDGTFLTVSRQSSHCPLEAQISHFSGLFNIQNLEEAEKRLLKSSVLPGYDPRIIVRSSEAPPKIRSLLNPRNGLFQSLFLMCTAEDVYP